MKVAIKVVLASSLVMALTVSILTWNQYTEVKNTLQEQSTSAIEEASDALAQQLTNWLIGKLELIDLAGQIIDSNFNDRQIQKTFDAQIFNDNFMLLFGGLATDGKAISNDPSWNPVNWDARKRPWYPLAQNANQAMITEPYVDSNTQEIVISVVAKLTDQGQFKGAFGGDLSLKTVSDALNSVDFNNAGYAFLVAENGNVISHPDIKNNGKNYSQLFAGNALKLDKHIQQIDVAGHSKWVSFTPLQGLRGMNWYIGVVVDADKVMSSANHIQNSALIGVLLSLIIGVLLLGGVMKVILKPISLLSQSLDDINSGNGDLTKRLPVISKDEFADVALQFNQFVAHLQDLISNVKNLASDASNSSEQAGLKAGQAAQELQSQLSELDQLATAMHEMAATAVEIAGNAQVAAQSASTAGNETENGVAIVAHATDAINQLGVQLEKAVDSVVELAQFSNNIESILSVITEIADQTNLLALNAAIEAARAGESGRGFAVVADEVRSLASRTQESTSEIKTMIEQLQSGVAQAENIIKQSREAATNTATEAAKANDSLDSIRAAIIDINDKNIQIAAAAEQQSATSEEINRNTTNIRDISQEVALGAQQQVVNAKNVQQEMAQQQQQLNQFKV